MTTNTSQNPFSFNNKSVVLPSGRYWVGDPCYVINSEWELFCDAHRQRINKSSSANFNGTNFFVTRTAHGDGTFSLNKDGEKIGWCGVDAGLLSIIPSDLIKLWNSKKTYRGEWPDMGGIWVEIKENTPVEPYGRGSFKFGSFDMNTDEF